MRKRFGLAALAALFFASAPVLAQNAPPFLPPAPANTKLVRLLAYPEYFDPAVLERFEKETGYAVAYDAYQPSDVIADHWREGPYDLVLLSGPALAHRIAAGALLRLDRAKLPGARLVQPLVASKLVRFDPAGAYAVALGWSPFGLIYDAGEIGSRPAPSSWADLFGGRETSRYEACGIVIPDARDDLFLAAWRELNIDPSRANLNEVKLAATLLTRAKAAARTFAAADIVSPLARGGACLSAGTVSEAQAAAARSALGGGAARPIRFVYAREGGPVGIDALAIPRDAPHPEQAYALLEFLLRPAIAVAAAASAGVYSAESPAELEPLKKLWPEGAFDAKIESAVETEWAHLRAAKK